MLARSLASLVLLAGCQGGTEPDDPAIVGSPAPSTNRDMVLRPGAVGSLRAGMPVAAALAGGLVSGDAEDPCSLVAADGLAVDITDGVLTTVVALEPGPATVRGIGPGSSVAELMFTYDEGEVSGPEVNRNNQWVYTMASEQRYLTFFVNTLDELDPTGTDVIGAAIASRGTPVTLYDGDPAC